MLTRKFAEWLAIALFVVIIAVVFQQIYTSMTEQGIASGGPYDNAAAYPKAIAILIGGLIAIQAVVTMFTRQADDEAEGVPFADLRRGAILIGIFAAYLIGLGTLGYHLATPAMIVATMWFGGARNLLAMIVFAIGLSLAVAFFFEVYLTIVLPGGLFGLNIPW